MSTYIINNINFLFKLLFKLVDVKCQYVIFMRFNYCDQIKIT